LAPHRDGSDSLGLRREVGQLPEAERRLVNELIPAEIDTGGEGAVKLLTAYKKLRTALPEMDRLRGHSSTEEIFSHNVDFSRCWWFPIGYFDNDETERVVIQRLFEDMEQGGRGVELEVLLADTPKRLLGRLDHAFLHGKWPNQHRNPAWTGGLIENIYGGKYRMNLQGHTRTRKNTSPPTDSD
jgi:hypothetical protein